jgi:hypothetical protein
MMGRCFPSLTSVGQSESERAHHEPVRQHYLIAILLRRVLGLSDVCCTDDMYVLFSLHQLDRCRVMAYCFLNIYGP